MEFQIQVKILSNLKLVEQISMRNRKRKPETKGSGSGQIQVLQFWMQIEFFFKLIFIITSPKF